MNEYNTDVRVGPRMEIVRQDVVALSHMVPASKGLLEMTLFFSDKSLLTFIATMQELFGEV